VIGWVDASSGASGDMLLGALLGAGVPLDVLAEAVRAVAPEPVSLRSETVDRRGIAAVRCHVDVSESTTHRTWRDVCDLLEAAPLRDGVRARAHRAFERLARAEAAVHGTPAEEVHFHEVGALDAIADVVGVCAGLEHLCLDRLVVSPVAVGAGRVHGAHGEMPVPPPAVAELLRGVPSLAGPGAGDGSGELCTPTGAALLTSSATAYGPQPAMTVRSIGVGAGGRDPDTHANVVRLLVGDAGAGEQAGTALVLEANVDDLDPRLWPDVITALLAAGAADAWLTPIVMKKGRPAHTLSALVAADRAPAVRTEIFRQTSTIGLREITFAKVALERRMHTVEVGGEPVRVKIALHDGRVVNVQPEYDDVSRLAARTGRPVKDVLTDAVLASRRLEHDSPQVFSPR
jgi:pyridinium-3,5-bisthiocarboxylic acid mononucleotide nickel chelatase